MSVIVTNGATNLSTASGFYRSDAYNTGSQAGGNNTSTGPLYLALSTTRTIPLTFANAGKCMGAIICVSSLYDGSGLDVSNYSKSITVTLQQIHTPVTMTIASPCVVTDTSHGLSDGQALEFATTGALPTGVTAGTTYYINASATATPTNTYWLYDTYANAIAGGATGRVNTSGTQSGTHSAWIDRASNTKTSTDLWVSQSYTGGKYFHDFSFGSGYTISTSASVWRLKVAQSTSGSGNWQISISDSAGNSPFYITYSDNAVTATSYVLKNVTFNTTTDVCQYTAHGMSNDTPIIFTTQGVLPTGINANTVYYVVNKTANDFQIASSVGGVFINLSGSPSGTTHCFGYQDMIVAKDKLTIDRDFAFRGYASTSYTAFNSCLIACASSSTSTNPYNWSMIDCQSPASAYMLVFDGCVTMSAHSSITFGSSGTPIPAGYLTMYFAYATTFGGTNAGSVITDAMRGNYYGGGGFAVYMYGAIPTQYCTLTAQANVGDTVLTVDSGTGFSSGDVVAVTKQPVDVSPNVSTYTVSSSTSTTITLGSAIATNDRLVGGKVMRVGQQGYGIAMLPTSSSGWEYVMRTNQFIGLVLSGVYINPLSGRIYSVFPSAYGWGNGDDVFLIQDSCIKGGWNSSTSGFLVAMNVNRQGTTVNRCNFFNDSTGGHFIYNLVNVTTAGTQMPFNSGDLVVTNNVFVGGIVSQLVQSFKTISGNISHNCRSGFMVSGLGFTHSNNEYYAIYGTGSVDHGAIVITSIKTTTAWTGNTYNRCYRAIVLRNASLFINTTLTTDTFGSLTANTYDLSINEDALADVLISNPTTSALLTYEGSLSYMITGSKIHITDETMTNEDRTLEPEGIIARVGDGLTDTTVHTSGSGNFAMRQNSLSASNRLEFIYTRPTGNIQNKDLVVGVWCKINSASYYAGSYQLPRLTVNYDNGTIAYVSASASTSWQFLVIPIRPTTTFGQITVTYSSMTDATGTNAYVYWDDASILDPAGVVVNTGGLDLWANALPITPIISTTVSAADVWAADPTTFGANTVGDSINRIDANASLIPAI